MKVDKEDEERMKKRAIEKGIFILLCKSLQSPMNIA